MCSQGLKPKQPCYIMRYAFQKEKFGTIVQKGLLGGATGDKEEVTAIVHLRDDMALGKENSVQIFNTFLV